MAKITVDDGMIERGLIGWRSKHNVTDSVRDAMRAALEGALNPPMLTGIQVTDKMIEAGFAETSIMDNMTKEKLCSIYTAMAEHDPKRPR